MIRAGRAGGVIAIVIINGVRVLVNPHVSACIATRRSRFLSRLPDEMRGVRLVWLAFGLASGLPKWGGLGSLAGDRRGSWGVPERGFLGMVTTRVVCIGDDEGFW